MNTSHANQRLEQAIANDLRTNELGIRVQVIDHRVVLRGEVASEERRAAVLTVAQEHMPASHIIDEIRLSDAADPPDGTERVDPL
ncbi:MAG: BON domain-containing protein [Aeromicrobium sp.]